jgi:hypothetical protein
MGSAAWTAAVRDVRTTRSFEAGRAAALLHQPIQINIGQDHLLVGRETFRFGQQLVILIDQRMAVPGKIGGRFAGTGCRIEISGNVLGRLGATQAAPIFGLANRDVARRGLVKTVAPLSAA